MKTVEKLNTKRIGVSEADYHMLRRDKRAKKEIKGLVLMLFDKVKRWNDESLKIR